MGSDVYASGEKPMVGDVVECVDASGNSLNSVGTRYTVSEIPTRVNNKWQMLKFTMRDADAYAHRFKLISRCAEPDAVGWIKGPPPDDCSVAWICQRDFYGGKWYRGDRMSGWNDAILWHIPAVLPDKESLPPPPPPPPPDPPKPIALPRRFRAKPLCGNAVDVTGCVLENGDYVWTGNGSSGRCKESVQDCYLSDIEFIDE